MTAPDAGTWELERPNVFEIDLQAIAHNARLLRTELGEARLFAALKADGYGYGAEAVAHTLSHSGIDGFATVSIGLATRLRASGIAGPILLYPGVPFTPESVAAADAFDLIPTIIDKGGADRLAALAQRPIGVYLKVDVGLERFGVPAEQVGPLLRHIGTLETIRVGGVYAHLHVPPGTWDAGYIDWQQDRFRRAVRAVSGTGVSPVTVMTASTGILAHHIPEQVDAADPGRWFFGLVDRHGTDDRQLRPALVSLKSQLVAAKAVDRRAYIDRSPLGSGLVRRIGIIPVGQVDGIERIAVGRVLVRGRSANILGAPFIEHTRIDLSAIPDAAAGDTVVLIGNQGPSCISPQEVAAYHGLPSPSLLALRIGPTFRRLYLQRTDPDKGSAWQLASVPEEDSPNESAAGSQGWRGGRKGTQ